jgi:hypothetical protein
MSTACEPLETGKVSEITIVKMSRHSSVDIATGCGLDYLGFDCLWHPLSGALTAEQTGRLTVGRNRILTSRVKCSTNLVVRQR